MNDSRSERHIDKPWVLLTNDDGYGTVGIEAMAQALGAWARVIVAAPTVEQSACSHKLTLARPLRYRCVGKNRYQLDGTPADCVYVGIYAGERLFGATPQLVVSGLNAGPNLGLDTHYSGTVAAAREAAIRGIAGLAVSADEQADYSRAAALCSKIAQQLWLAVRQDNLENKCGDEWRDKSVKKMPVVNVNVPAQGAWKLCRTTPGWRTYGEGVDLRRDPRGRAYLWLGGCGGVSNDLTEGTDTLAHHRGDVSITYLPLVASQSRCDELIDKLIDGVQKTRERRPGGYETA